MKILNPKFHKQKFVTEINIDVEELRKRKIDIGAINKETSIEDSLSYDLTQLEIDVENFIKNYFYDYGKDIVKE
tara:strand:- start:317 stop:538 length:222 start_codon:yes stop_codon:yes gene_type:complete